MALSQPQSDQSGPVSWQPQHMISPQGQAARQHGKPQERNKASSAKKALKVLSALWTKITND